MHERIGIMGGTFDPVHNGHLVIARSVADQLGLDRVLFIPAGNPNFKQDQKLASAADRVRMVELAIANEPDFELDLREVERPGVTYTADTLEELVRCHEDARLFFIMGTDSAITLSGDSSGMDAPALGSAVGVKTSVFSGVWLVLVSLSSPPRTAAMRALASLTEFSSGFMT